MDHCLRRRSPPSNIRKSNPPQVPTRHWPFRHYAPAISHGIKSSSTHQCNREPTDAPPSTKSCGARLQALACSSLARIFTYAHHIERRLPHHLDDDRESRAKEADRDALRSQARINQQKPSQSLHLAHRCRHETGSGEVAHRSHTNPNSNRQAPRHTLHIYMRHETLKPHPHRHRPADQAKHTSCTRACAPFCPARPKRQPPSERARLEEIKATYSATPTNNLAGVRTPPTPLSNHDFSPASAE